MKIIVAKNAFGGHYSEKINNEPILFNYCRKIFTKLNDINRASQRKELYNKK